MSCDCGEYIRLTLATLGAEAVVRPVKPIVQGPFTVEPFTCPHGVKWWPEPTGEQIAQWAADGVL